MHIAGVVAEYNPFHNGHEYQLSETRRLGATHIVVVMSGWYVQRGEPSLISPFERAAMAIDGGADLVIGLPVGYSLCSAERFARGAVGILGALGCVDSISFGCEDDSLDFKAAALFADTISHKGHAQMLELLDRGISYPKAVYMLCKELAPELEETFANPNNILAVEYARALTYWGMQADLIPIKRWGAGHDEDNPKENFASASYIRQYIRESGSVDNVKKFMPKYAYDRLATAVNGHALVEMGRLDVAAMTAFRTADVDSLCRLVEVGSGDGLSERIIKMACNWTDIVDGVWNLETFLHAVKSKRYTLAKLRRIAIANCIGMSRREFCNLPLKAPPYGWILGMNRRGKEILGIKQRDFLCSTSFSKLVQHSNAFGNLEAMAADIWGLCSAVPAVPGMIYKVMPYIC